MRILITGNMGYVGSVLGRHLRQRLPQAELIGFDTGYFGHCLTTRGALPELALDRQIFGDIRHPPEGLLDGVDAVAHLAAISNDPMGNRFERVTDDVNHRSALRIAEMADQAGAKAFVFASSCSVYGAAGEDSRREDDELNPLTAYARSKISTEIGLAEADLGGLCVTSLRFATACGMSDRLRLDLVLNDFVACALATRKITVLSDGTPWRPLIDVADMARAIEWALLRGPEDGGQRLVVNAGADDWNYTVRDLAEAVRDAIPGTSLAINTEATKDQRSYRVSFARFRDLAPDHQPAMTLEASIGRLAEGLRSIGFDDADFRASSLVRLRMLGQHIDAGRLSDQLRWTAGSCS